MDQTVSLCLLKALNFRKLGQKIAVDVNAGMWMKRLFIWPRKNWYIEFTFISVC